MTFTPKLSRHRLFVLAVLGIAFALRLYIVVRGRGDYYWADEMRFQAARVACASVAQGNYREAVRAMFSTAGHIGFRWITLPVAAVERAVLQGRRYDARICTASLVPFAVMNLWLVWLIARRMGGTETEAGWALVFAAASNALFFHARHCFPYDTSLTFLLAAVYVSIGPVWRWQPLVVGLCCGGGYLVYNGYWSVAAVVLIFDVLWRRENFAERARRVVLSGSGLLAPILVVFGAARLAGYDLIKDSIAFADTVNQGDFGAGWRFVFQYLWVADGALWIVLGSVIVAGTAACALRGAFQPWLRWVAMFAALYVIWVLLSDVVYKFVLYGRTVRAAVPFLALSAAGALDFLGRRGGPAFRGFLIGAAAMGVAAGCWMMRAPLQQIFPRQFARMAEPIMAEVRARDPEAVLQLVYADYIHDFIEELPPHRELLRRPHPHQYLPYLYEGYTETQRPLYANQDIAMRLVQLDTSRGLHLFKRVPVSRWLAPYPGSISMFVRLPKEARGREEWLLAHTDDTGRPRGVLIEYLDTSHLRLGFVNARDEPQMSEPIPCDYDADHAIGISLVSLFPPETDVRFAQHASIKRLCRKAIITFDHQVVFDRAGEFSPRALEDWAIGGKIHGEGMPARPFSGTVHSVRQIDPQKFAVDRPVQRAVLITGPLFADYFGPVEMQLRFPKFAGEGAEPLLATGGTGAGDLLYVCYLDSRRVQLKLDHWGTPSLSSPVIDIEPTAVQRLVISFGSLLPPENPRYVEHSHLRPLRSWLYVSLNGRVVFSRPFDFYAAEPDAVSVGASIPGGTACAPTFAGEIIEVRRTPPEEIFPAGAPLPRP